MHQTSSRLLRMTDDDRPFTRVSPLPPFRFAFCPPVFPFCSWLDGGAIERPMRRCGAADGDTGRGDGRGHWPSAAERPAVAVPQASRPSGVPPWLSEHVS